MYFILRGVFSILFLFFVDSFQFQKRLTLLAASAAADVASASVV